MTTGTARAVRDDMLTRRALVVGVLAILLYPVAAAAGPWYYKWSCTGRCSGDRLAIEGREGPFASRDDCEWARDRDTRADEFVAEGNLGGLDFCYEDTTVSGGGGVAAPRRTRSAPAARARRRSRGRERTRTAAPASRHPG